jgi:hypothetical protein
MTILGIDPGKSGAVAVLDEGGELLKVHDTPSTLEPNGRSATNAPLLASILARSHARIAYGEFVGAKWRRSPSAGLAASSRAALLMTPQTQQGKATR